MAGGDLPSVGGAASADTQGGEARRPTGEGDMMRDNVRMNMGCLCVYIHVHMCRNSLV